MSADNRFAQLLAEFGSPSTIPYSTVRESTHGHVAVARTSDELVYTVWDIRDIQGALDAAGRDVLWFCNCERSKLCAILGEE